MHIGFVLQHLKSQTQVWHDKTEVVAYSAAIKFRTLTFSQYKDLLQKNHYIHQRLETALFNYDGSEANVADIFAFAHTRLPDLQRDMVLNSVSATSFPIQYHPEYTQSAQLIGQLYVIEGSSMGGRMIAGLLSQIPTFVDAAPFHFFSQPGQISPRKRWQQLNQLAETHVQSEQALQQATDTTISVFRFFHDVYAHSRVG